MTTVGEAVQAGAQAMIGMRLRSVRYYDIPYGMTETPGWDFEVAHVTAYGLDFVSDERTTGITWTQYGDFGHGLRLVDQPVVTTLLRGEFTEVSGVEPWDRITGNKVTSVEVHWIDMTVGGTEFIGPNALTLRFANNRALVLVCGTWNGPDKEIFPTGNDIVIIWKPGIVPVLAPYLPSDLLNQ